MFYLISVIPLAAEHSFLEWLNKRFGEIGEGETWSAWLQLLRLVYYPRGRDPEQQSSGPTNAANSLMEIIMIDVEIFDDTEPNTFGESNYTAYNCFNYMVKNMNDCASLDMDSKEKIYSEFPILRKR